MRWSPTTAARGPPRSPTIVARAVATIVESSAASSITSIQPLKNDSQPLGRDGAGNSGSGGGGTQLERCKRGYLTLLAAALRESACCKTAACRPWTRPVELPRSDTPMLSRPETLAPVLLGLSTGEDQFSTFIRTGKGNATRTAEVGCRFAGGGAKRGTFEYSNVPAATQMLRGRFLDPAPVDVAP
jgi:hypothetical protein